MPGVHPKSCARRGARPSTPEAVTALQSPSRAAFPESAHRSRRYALTSKSRTDRRDITRRHAHNERMRHAPALAGTLSDAHLSTMSLASTSHASPDRALSWQCSADRRPPPRATPTRAWLMHAPSSDRRPSRCAAAPSALLPPSSRARHAYDRPLALAAARRRWDVLCCGRAGVRGCGPQRAEWRRPSSRAAGAARSLAPRRTVGSDPAVMAMADRSPVLAAAHRRSRARACCGRAGAPLLRPHVYVGCGGPLRRRPSGRATGWPRPLAPRRTALRRSAGGGSRRKLSRRRQPCGGSRQRRAHRGRATGGSLARSDAAARPRSDPFTQ